jgi:hypothetical protein
MHLKTQYRERNNSEAAIPAVEINTPPSSTVAVDTDNPEVAAAVAAAEKADETAQPANMALRKQIDALHNAEQFQRQRLEQAQYERQVRLMQMQPPSREQKIEAWKQAGLSAANEEFMWAHPELIDHHEVTR